MTPLSDAITGMRTAALTSRRCSRYSSGPSATIGSGAKRPRLGERIAVAFGVEERVHLLAGDFLFVQRAQHQQRGAGIFERPDGVQIVAERSGADDQRMGQAHPEVRGAEIHHFSLESGLRRLLVGRLNHRHGDAGELLIHGVAALGGRLRLRDERLVAGGIGALDHPEARLVAQVVGDLALSAARSRGAAAVRP